MNNPLIAFANVTKRFGQHTVLHDVNLQIDEGHITTIIGKSGSGKSVLLKHMIGLLTPDEGQVFFQGVPLHEMSKRSWNAYRRQISFMFQHNALFDSMTVFENVALPLRQTTRLNRKTIEEKVMARIEQTELSDVAHHYPAELSGGMQKRVALSRALVTDPKIVLFDEPTTGQDMIRRNAILSMIVEYQKKFGFTAVLISHDVPDVLFISHRILALYEGAIIFQGTPEELETFEHPFMDEFLHSLESFQDHLTGPYSKRQFKMRYREAWNVKHQPETYVIALIALDEFDLLCERLGHTTAQEVIQSLGTTINTFFRAVGGFSVRRSRSEFATVLPFADLNEAEHLLDDFVAALQKQHLWKRLARGARPTDQGCELSVSAGLAEGTSSEEIDPILARAESLRRTIVRFPC
jgi:phospholipid/cholesterol/gamma-HCH transport system ATP-binding protein